MLRRWLFGTGEHRPRSRLSGCLLWILLLIALLIVASLLFGGFHKGTKADAPMAATTSVSMTRSLAGPVTSA